jgi:hypothetical protein
MSNEDSNHNGHVTSDCENSSMDDVIVPDYDAQFNEINLNIFEEVQNIRKDYLGHVIISHLNVNSLNSKIQEIKELQSTCKLDVLVLSETKLDASFKQEIFHIEGYSCVRQDKRSNSGGMMIYISNDIPFSTGSIQICNDDLECLSIELNISNEKIMLTAMYKNPKTDPVIFKRFFEETCEHMSDHYENIIVIGDLNFNMLQDNMLKTIIPTFNFTNVINDVTCSKSSNPTLIDVMLVTKRRKIMSTFSKDVGISDFHNLIGGVLRIHKPTPKTKRVSYRQLSKVDYDKILSDLCETNLMHSLLHSNNADEACKSIQGQLLNLLDKHAPKKQKIIKKSDFHCMTKELRRAILHRNKLRNKYYKFRSQHYLSLYKTQRNVVNSIKRQEIRKYFEEKCKTGTRNKDFWKAIKPLFSKSRTKADSIPLRENGEIVTDDLQVCNIFNKFFQSIGSDIGNPEDNDKPITEIISNYANHKSVTKISEDIRMQNNQNVFMFRFVTKREVIKIIKSLSSQKAAGYDEIPAKFIKKLSIKLAEPLTLLINQCILENTFPSEMKKANITPLYKKKDKLNKDNYRSVNLLPILSKILEKALFNQVYEYMAPLFHSYLTGFRKGHGCQDILIRMTEDWRESLDNNLTIGVIAIDLSKAFDCMPHGLLLAKMSAYGFDEDSCKLMGSYLMNRHQRVKIGETFSDWVKNIKGVPQGSILGPLLFNIFINDFLYFDFNSKIYNYADDNTLSCVESDLTLLKQKLESDCLQAMQWFEFNSMKANASKFQLMFLSRNESLETHSINISIGSTDIRSTHSINILGIELDNKLRFQLHTDEICGQAAKQINALKRIKQHLDKQCKQVIYNTYINSNFNYCSVVWMFINKTNMEKLEKTNKRAMRFVSNRNNMSYEDMCSHEKQLSVRKRCMKTVAVLMYKLRKNLAPGFLNDLITLQETQYDMRDNEKFVMPQYNTVQFGKNSIKYFGAKLWNTLPLRIKEKPSLSTFKSAVTNWLLENDIE